MNNENKNVKETKKERKPLPTKDITKKVHEVFTINNSKNKQ